MRIKLLLFVVVCMVAILPLATAQPQTHTKYDVSLPNSGPIMRTLNVDDTMFTYVQFRTPDSANNAGLAVYYLRTEPIAQFALPIRNVIQYATIEPFGFTKSEDVTIEFTIPIAIVTQRSIDTSRIVLFHYDEQQRKWQRLTTQRIGTSEKGVQYRAQAPALGNYAIALLDQGELGERIATYDNNDAEPSTKEDETNPANTNNAPQPPLPSPNNDKENNDVVLSPTPLDDIPQQAHQDGTTLEQIALYMAILVGAIIILAVVGIKMTFVQKREEDILLKQIQSEQVKIFGKKSPQEKNTDELQTTQSLQNKSKEFKKTKRNDAIHNNASKKKGLFSLPTMSKNKSSKSRTQTNPQPIPNDTNTQTSSKTASQLLEEIKVRQAQRSQQVDKQTETASDAKTNTKNEQTEKNPHNKLLLQNKEEIKETHNPFIVEHNETESTQPNKTESLELQLQSLQNKLKQLQDSTLNNDISTQRQKEIISDIDALEPKIIKTFIQTERKQGADINQIKQHLLQAGFTKTAIEQHLRGVHT